MRIQHYLMIFILSVVCGFAFGNVKSPHSKQQIDCLALMAYKEARGEPAKGRRAVMDVMLNRVKHREFPDTVCGNLKPDQYQWLRKGRKINNHEQYMLIRQEAERVYVQFIMGDWRDTTGGAYFFSSNGVVPAKRAYKKVRIAGHQFFGLKKA